jgi:hypothetical protein
MYITSTFSFYLHVFRLDLDVLLRFYYDFMSTDNSIGGTHMYYYRSRGSYIIVVLEYIITLEHSKLLCLRTYIIILRGAREIFGVFHVKNHDFTPKKSYFFQF